MVYVVCVWCVMGVVCVCVGGGGIGVVCMGDMCDDCLVC